MLKKIDRNILKLLPLLFVYIIILLVYQENNLQGDEYRYWMYAYNLAVGSYLPDYSVYLWNGPGYPLILLPFALLKLWLPAKLMNIVFLYVAIVFFYCTLKIYLEKNHALPLAFLTGLYLPFFRYLHQAATEVFSIFLVFGFIFYFCKLYRTEKIKWSLLIIASCFLGYLALTKIFFGYVMLSGLVLFIILFIIRRKTNYKKIILMYLLALIFCLPYLIYTHSLTGKVFYWGHSGGMSLYWMSSPFEKDLGDWRDPNKVKYEGYFYSNHSKFFREIKNLSFTEMDEKFRERAIENIINNPFKFFKNWLSNIGRLLFNFPYSFTPQKLSTYFFVIPNMFVVVFCVICLYPSFKRHKLIPFEIFALLLFALISFMGSSLLSAYNRQFTLLVPFFLLWIFFTLIRILKVEIRR